MRPMIASTGRRLGELVGGDEGRALIAGSDSLFTALGVKDPARSTLMMLG